MSKDYVKKAGISIRKAAPQYVKVREDQVINEAGGYVFKVNDMERLRRFLILGTEGGTYYVSEKTLTKDNAAHIIKMLDKDGHAVVDETVKISDEGRAAKNDPAIFVLALAATHKDESVRSYALKNLKKVCRISTHLFTFATFIKNLKTSTGWGTMLRRAFANWYNSKEAENVAYQICKYPSRRVEGEKPWSHSDILRKAHVEPATDNHSTAFRYAIAGHSDDIRYYVDKKGGQQVSKTQPISGAELCALDNNKALRYIVGHAKAKQAMDASQIVELIRNYNLVRESIPNEFYNTKKVMNELVQNMPMTATIRLLNVMTNVGTLAPMNDNVQLVCDRITDEVELKKARIHPIALLAALRTYSSGKGFRGELTWNPISAIKDALEDAFYKSFEYVAPTGKNHLLAVDVSSSMTCGRVIGLPMITPNEGAAVMAMTIARSEPNYEILGFCHELRDLGITAKDTLNSAIKKTQDRSFGGTDCSLPMIWAKRNKVPVDAFIIITDNETWFNSYRDSGHSFQELKAYRVEMNRPKAKMIVIGMTATEFSIADPNDNGSLNIVGFDANAPAIINEFVRGNI